MRYQVMFRDTHLAARRLGNTASRPIRNHRYDCRRSAEAAANHLNRFAPEDITCFVVPVAA